MNLFMVVTLVLITLLAIRGTLYNKKTKNQPGFILGGLFTLGLVGCTLLAIYDLVLGINTLLPYLPW